MLLNNNVKIIAIEGLDGVGKSTQIKLLEEYLATKNLNFKTYKFPNETLESFKALKKEISQLNKHSLEFTNLAKKYCYNRIETIHNELRNHNVKPIMIFDRSIFSTLQYQLANIVEYSYFLEKSKNLTDYENQYIPIPILTIYLELPLEKNIDRLKSRGNLDTIEKDISFLTKVHNNKHRLEHYPNLVTINCDNLDENEISKQIIKLVNDVLHID